MKGLSCMRRRGFWWVGQGWKTFVHIILILGAFAHNLAAFAWLIILCPTEAVTTTWTGSLSLYFRLRTPVLYKTDSSLLLICICPLSWAYLARCITACACYLFLGPHEAFVYILSSNARIEWPATTVIPLLCTCTLVIIWVMNVEMRQVASASKGDPGVVLCKLSLSCITNNTPGDTEIQPSYLQNTMKNIVNLLPTIWRKVYSILVDNVLP